MLGVLSTCYVKFSSNLSSPLTSNSRLEMNMVYIYYMTGVCPDYIATALYNVARIHKKLSSNKAQNYLLTAIGICFSLKFQGVSNWGSL
jgi:hypothetical protein